MVFVYREWSKAGDTTTRDIGLQNERWDSMETAWKSLGGNDKTILMGDMNFCMINITNSYQRQFDHIRDSVYDNFLLDGYTQLVEDFTRYQTNDTPGLLDHIYVNDVRYIERVYNVSMINSDHNLVGLRLCHDGPVRRVKTFTKRDIKGIDQKKFEDQLLLTNLWEIFLENDVDTALHKLNLKIRHVLDIHAPEKLRVVRGNDSKWITPELRRLLDRRKFLHEVAQRSGDQNDWSPRSLNVS